MRTLQRLLVTFAFAIAGLFVSSATLATPAYACGYYTGYDDCGQGGGSKPFGWDTVNPNREYKPFTQKSPGRHNSFDLQATQQRKCPLWCGEGYAQRNFNNPGPQLQNYPSWYDAGPKSSGKGGSGRCPNGGPAVFGQCGGNG